MTDRNTPDTQPAFVAKFYEMDPDVDDLLPDGTHLRNGMVVLIEESLVRADETRCDDRWERPRLLEANRWCEVSYLTVTPRYDDSGFHCREISPLISFVGVYPDGTKRKRQYDASYAWLVRKFSMDAER